MERSCWLHFQSNHWSQTTFDQLTMEISDTDESLPDMIVDFTPSPSKCTWNSKKSINELLQDTISLMEDCKTDYILKMEVESYMENISLSNIADQGHELVSPGSPMSEVEETELNFFCVNNYLQYFNLRDVILQMYGYSLSDLTQCNEFPITSKPENIESILSTIVSGFSTPVNVESCLKHVKPFTYFLLKILALGEKEATVQACKRVLSIILNDHSGITFTCEEIFILLFNYGVDIKNLEKLKIFESVPKVKVISKSYSCSSTIPFNWLYNFEVLLNAIEDLISKSCFTDSDLTTMIKYFLGVYLDSSIQNEYPVIWNLTKCTTTALASIQEERWPYSFSSICKFIMSLEKISALSCWHIILQVENFFPNATTRMSQIKIYISLNCLKKLSGDTTENEPSLPNVNYNISDLRNILESINLIEDQNFHIAVKFLDICISHLNLVSKEEHEELYVLLKRWEGIIATSVNSTLKEQKLLVRMCTKIFLMAPDQPSEMDLEKEEKVGGNDQDVFQDEYKEDTISNFINIDGKQADTTPMFNELKKCTTKFDIPLCNMLLCSQHKILLDNFLEFKKCDQNLQAENEEECTYSPKRLLHDEINIRDNQADITSNFNELKKCTTKLYIPLCNMLLCSHHKTLVHNHLKSKNYDKHIRAENEEMEYTYSLRSVMKCKYSLRSSLDKKGIYW